MSHCVLNWMKYYSISQYKGVEAQIHNPERNARQNNIFRTISAQTAAKMVCFHVYWVPILWPRQNNIPRSVLVLTAAEIFHFHMYWVHILSGASQMYCHMLSSNMDQCWSFKYSHHVHSWATLCYLTMQKSLLFWNYKCFVVSSFLGLQMIVVCFSDIL